MKIAWCADAHIAFGVGSAVRKIIFFGHCHWHVLLVQLAESERALAILRSEKLKIKFYQIELFNERSRQKIIKEEDSAIKGLIKC